MSRNPAEETSGDKGRQGAQEPGKKNKELRNPASGTHMKGDKGTQVDIRSPGTRQKQPTKRGTCNAVQGIPVPPTHFARLAAHDGPRKFATESPPLRRPVAPVLRHPNLLRVGWEGEKLSFGSATGCLSPTLPPKSLLRMLLTHECFIQHATQFKASQSLPSILQHWQHMMVLESSQPKGDGLSPPLKRRVAPVLRHPNLLPAHVDFFSARCCQNLNWNYWNQEENTYHICEHRPATDQS